MAPFHDANLKKIELWENLGVTQVYTLKYICIQNAVISIQILKNLLL
jgi:hypothetical protein